MATRTSYPDGEPKTTDVIVVNKPNVAVPEGVNVLNFPSTQDVNIVGQTLNPLVVDITSQSLPSLGVNVTNFPSLQDVSISELPMIRDAFSRLRVSQAQGLFDSQFTYDLQPLLFEQLTNGTGAAVTHDTVNRQAVLTLSSTPAGGYASMQSYDHFRYQPGKSQLILITFNAEGGAANATMTFGYSDGNNGIDFAMIGTTPAVRILSDTGSGDVTVNQGAWNMDNLDGNGPSGKTANFAKTQVLVIDFQALYVGAVRIGFFIDGNLHYVHTFYNANVSAFPYIQTANLPIRVSISCTDTVTKTAKFICCAVSSEGGQEEVTGYTFSGVGEVTAASGSRTHLLSLRPKTLFNSMPNRTTIVLQSLDILVTGINPIKWELVIGQAISGTTTFNDIHTAYSAFEYNTAGTASGNPEIVIATGYIAAGVQSRATSRTAIPFKYPITLNAAGSHRSLGTVSVLVTGLGGTSASYATLTWREIR